MSVLHTTAQWLLQLPWELLIMACLTLGLAPFSPPHIVEKLGMLASGTLVKPIDWFDLVMHGTPWVLLIAKAIAVSAAGPGTMNG